MTRAPFRWQAMATIGAALLGLVGVIFSSIVGSKLNYNAADNLARVEGIVEQLNNQVLPIIQKQYDSMQEDLRLLSSTVVELRERVTMLEQKVKPLKSGSKITVEEFKRLSGMTELKIDTLQLPGIAMEQKAHEENVDYSY